MPAITAGFRDEFLADLYFECWPALMTEKGGAAYGNGAFIAGSTKSYDLLSLKAEYLKTG